MAMFTLFALLGLSLLNGAENQLSGVPQLNFQVSHPQPFIGQTVRLDLFIEVPPQTIPSKEVVLQIPWLYREEVGFRWQLPADQWVCRQTLVVSQQMARLGAHRIGLDAVSGKNSFRLSWNLQVQEPDPLQPEGLYFAPVSMRLKDGTLVRSNELRLKARPLPVPPSMEGTVFLGVGTFRLETRISPTIIRLGADCVLELRVDGSGDLDAIRTPPLAQFPPWRSEAFSLETLLETWENQEKVRCFRYRIKPRQAIKQLDLPPVRFAFFDPQSGQYVTEHFQVPRVMIDLPAATSATQPSWIPPDQLPSSLRWHAGNTEPSTEAFGSVWTWAGIFGPPLAVMLFLAVAQFWDRRRGGYAPTVAGRTAWRVLHDQRHGTIADRAPLAMSAYLRLRYGLELAEPTFAEIQRCRSMQQHSDVLNAIQEFFTSLDSVRFGPHDAEIEKSLLAKAEALFQLWERRR